MDEQTLNEALDSQRAWIHGGDEAGTRAQLIGADLHEANLRDADLREADLRGVNLTGADLSGADMRGAKPRQRCPLECVPRERAPRSERHIFRCPVVNGLMRTGCQWRAIPKDLPPRSTLFGYFELWVTALA